MIKLIVGNKGSGKTKALINMVNNAVKTTKGNVVCVEPGTKLTYDIDHKARLIDTDAYAIDGFDSFYGFLSGILAGNYDITEMFVDSTLKVGGRDFEALDKMIHKLIPLAEESDTILTFTLSCDLSELSDALKVYSIDY